MRINKVIDLLRATTVEASLLAVHCRHLGQRMSSFFHATLESFHTLRRRTRRIHRRHTTGFFRYIPHTASHIVNFVALFWDKNLLSLKSFAFPLWFSRDFPPRSQALEHCIHLLAIHVFRRLRQLHLLPDNGVFAPDKASDGSVMQRSAISSMGNLARARVFHTWTVPGRGRPGRTRLEAQNLTDIVIS